MILSKKWLVFILVVMGLQFVIFEQWTEGALKKNGPAKIEPLTEEISRITLTPRAAERLDIQTAPIKEFNEKGMQGKKVIPYSAVLYDPTGTTWAYTNPEPLVFVRKQIKIDYIEGDRAILNDGPPINTKVVTIGVIELYGAETGIGK